VTMDIANSEEGCVVVGFQACHITSVWSHSFWTYPGVDSEFPSEIGRAPSQ
jgi:hypothetical protein